MSMVDVAVVGAGPVGLSTALGLAKQGFTVELFEAETSLSTEARASTIHPPTLEAFAQWGVADAVIERGIRVERLQYWELGSRTLVAEFDYRRIAEDTAFPFRLQCPQHTVIPLLAQAFEETGTGRVRFGHRLEGFEADADGVDVRLQTKDTTRSVRARYLVGADGAASAVRNTLGLSFSGKTYEDRFLLVPTEVDLEAVGFGGIGPVAYMFDPDQWVISMRVPDALRLVFRLRDDEDPDAALEPDAIARRLHEFLGVAAPPAKLPPSVYRVHQRVAERFRVGRVLLAGDAAHINNPAGGMGMNSGVHDAAHLVTALTQTLSGDVPEAGVDPLEDYAETRRRVAVERVQAHTDAHYAELVASDPETRKRRNERYAAAAADPTEARRWLLRRAMMEERA